MDVIDILRAELHIDELVREIKNLRKELQKNTGCGPKYYTPIAACEKKGISYNTIKSKKCLQPNSGAKDIRIGGH